MVLVGMMPCVMLGWLEIGTAFTRGNTVYVTGHVLQEAGGVPAISTS